jgi:hypothetical protein
MERMLVTTGRRVGISASCESASPEAGNFHSCNDDMEPYAEQLGIVVTHRADRYEELEYLLVNNQPLKKTHRP